MKIVIRNLEIEISPKEIKYLQQIDKQIDKIDTEIKEKKETEKEIEKNKIGF